MGNGTANSVLLKNDQSFAVDAVNGEYWPTNTIAEEFYNDSIEKIE